jgi:hypothetical protein
MAIIDPEGLFGGDRLRRCSNLAQLHWPRLFLASNGFARIEINYARIIGRAYPTFNPIPSETELQAWIQEYVRNHLLFIYEAGGQLWGQWDTRSELLPRFKKATDRRSPKPPEPAFAEWKLQYRIQNTALPKCLGNISETLQHGVGGGVGVGGGKNICASDDACVSGLLPSVDNPPFETTEPGALFPVDTPVPENRKPRQSAADLSPDQERWFALWWPEYWRPVAKKPARSAFRKHIRTEARFQQIMAATRAQMPEMLSRPKDKRPYPATWLNEERWEDEIESAAGGAPQDDYPELES